MKVKCQQKDLALALNLVNRAVSPNTTLPVLNNILIKAQGKRIYFSATNLEVAITYFIDANVLNEGAITLPAKLISNYISLLKEEEVEMKLEEGLNLSIKTSLSHTKIKGIDCNEFPLIPEVEQGNTFSISSGLLNSAINQVVFATSINVARPVLTGVLFHIDKDKLSIVATDSYRLSERVLGLRRAINDNLDCIIPSRTIVELGKILGVLDVDEIECSVTKNQVLFSLQNLRIISRLIEGTFPDYKRIIPVSNKTHITLSVDEFILAVRKVSLFVQETNNNIKVSVTNNGKLIVSTDETQIGEGTSEVDVVIEGENNKIALNAQYLLDVLHHIEDDKVHLDIDNKLSPITIKPLKKEVEYTHIIMPLKL